MTQEDHVEKHIQNYVSEIKNAYYEASHLSHILEPLYTSGKDNNLIKLETGEIKLEKRNLMRLNNYYRGSGTIGNYLVKKEILYLISKMDEITSFQKYDEFSPSLLAQSLIPNNRRYFILVSRNLFSKFTGKPEWLIEYNKEKNRRETKLGSPPAPIILLPEPVKNKVYIIDQPFGIVKYYSNDQSPNNRLDIQRTEDGFTIRLLGILWLYIDLHPMGDSSIFTLPED